MALSVLCVLALVPFTSGFLLPQAGGCGCGAPPPPPCAAAPPPCAPPPPPCPQLPPLPAFPPLPAPCPPPPPPCGCAPALPAFPPLHLPSLPAFPAPCAPPPPCGCGRKKRSAVTVRSESVSSERLCTNQNIRSIILKNLNEDASVSKAAIHAEVKAKLNGNFVVLCSKGPFSFVADSHNYCIVGSNAQTCYVFEI